MGSGYRGNFGATKGSNSIAASKNNSVLTIKTVGTATTNIKKVASRAPLSVPKHASYEVQNKNGYKQIKYNFSRNNKKYEVRWHTQTPNAPKETGSTYQVTRKKSGKGYGKEASKKVLDHMIKYPSGKIKWVSNNIYQDAIRNNKNGVATKKEKEMIKYGHIK